MNEVTTQNSVPVEVQTPENDLSNRYTLADLGRQEVRRLFELYTGRLSALRSALIAEQYAAQGSIDATLQRALDYCTSEEEVGTLLRNTTQTLAIDATVERLNRALSAVFDWQNAKNRECEGLPNSGPQRKLLVEKRKELEWLRTQAESAEQELAQRATSMSTPILMENKQTIDRFRAAAREVQIIERSLVRPEEFEFHEANILKQLVINALGISKKR